ncbi:hypothetical protein GGI02_003154 [Coemansia sp. RSA 2322]|nr:hypothetical protein GGI02_003154 [Coemansia sp. RSA 2322]
MTVVARRWCTDTEQLTDSVSAADCERIRLGIWDLDSGLGAYPLETSQPDSSYGRWVRLSRHITASTLSRVLPDGGVFSSATGSAYEDEEMAAAQRMLERKTGMAALAVPASSETDRLRFPYIDLRRSVPPNADPSLVCQYGMDKSWALASALHTHWGGGAGGGGELLGEFQLAYLIILVGQNFTGLEHWKRILHLVFGSAQALEDSALVNSLFVPLIKALYYQLKECPEEFGASVLDQDNFVGKVLATLVLNVYECGNPATAKVLAAEVDMLRALLAQRFQWELPQGKQLQEEADVEEGEFAPQVVDLE